MSFEKVKKAELKKAVEFFGVDVDPDAGVKEMRAALEQDGVTYEDYVKFLVPDEQPEAQVEPEPEPEPEPVAAAPARKKQVLVKMERRNPIYEIGKYRFTRRHPFQLVDEDDVDNVVRNHEGFSLATPTEAREFYS